MNVLIITEYFFPSNRTASFRPMAWAKYFPQYGISPIFVTATPNAKDYDYETLNVIDEKSIIRVECKQPFIRKLRYLFSGSILGRFFGLIDEAFDNYSFYNPLKQLRPAIQDALNQSSIDLIIVTAPNFALIDIARKLAKENHIDWVVDFRDDWVTNEEVTGFTKFKYRFEKHLFKSYVKGAKYLIAVSDHQRQKLEKLSGIKTVLFGNGYDFYDEASPQKTSQLDTVKFRQEHLNLIYTGTLYKSQDLSYLQSVLDHCPQDLRDHISLYFIGANTTQLTAFSKKNKNIHLVTDRVSKHVADEMLEAADIAMYIAYRKPNGAVIKGVPSSKIYEYIKLKKPVFLLPSDNDVAKQILDQVGLNISGKSIDQNVKLLEKYLRDKHQLSQLKYDVNLDAYHRFSRAEKTSEFAHWLLDHF